MTKKNQFMFFRVMLLGVLLFCANIVFGQDQSPYIQIVLQPVSNSWTHQVGDSVKLNVSVTKNHLPIKNIKVSYEIGLEGMPIEKRGTLTIKECSEKICLGTLSTPGFKRCVVNTNIDGIEYSSMATVGYSPDKIKPTVDEPSDFDLFWENEITNMRQSNSNIQETVLNEFSTSEKKVSLLSINIPECEVAFYGYLSKPKKKGKFPVLLYYPGAGIGPTNPISNLVNEDVITLSIEIHGLNPQGDAKLYREIKNKFMSYPYMGVESRDMFYYKSVILACVKAADYACGLDSFDNTNLITFGGSQGGFLSIATAALYQKVTGLVAFHPSMADLTGYFNGRVGGCPHYFAPKFNGIYNSESIIETLSYFDTVNFARRISVPGFYSFGYNDVTCPPTTCFAVTNSIDAPKTIFLTPITGHWRIPEMMTKSASWVKEQLQ